MQRFKLRVVSKGLKSGPFGSVSIHPLPNIHLIPISQSRPPDNDGNTLCIDSCCSCRRKSVAVNMTHQPRLPAFFFINTSVNHYQKAPRNEVKVLYF